MEVPNTLHQEISGNLSVAIWNYLKDGGYKVLTLENRKYFANSYLEDEILVSSVLKGLEIPLAEIFPPKEAEQDNIETS